MRIVLLGGPGAGKGTQAQKLSREYDLQHIATGDILRQAVKDETEMGLMARSYMDKGLLVPDDVVVGIIKEYLSRRSRVLGESGGRPPPAAQPDARSGFILDGFPRTVAQAEALDDLTAEMDMPLDAVVNIKTSEGVVVQRLSGRRTCRDCQTVYHIVYSPPEKAGICDRCGGQLYQREDDKEETIRKRLQVYEKQTSPLIDYYRKSGKLMEVSGDGTIEEVYASIRHSISHPPG